MINETEVRIIQELFLCPIDNEKFDFFERKPLVLVPCVRKFSNDVSIKIKQTQYIML